MPQKLAKRPQPSSYQ
jgi:hypothetical protein